VISKICKFLISVPLISKYSAKVPVYVYVGGYLGFRCYVLCLLHLSIIISLHSYIHMVIRSYGSLVVKVILYSFNIYVHRNSYKFTFIRRNNDDMLRNHRMKNN